jgi:hypothetical protein
VISLFFLNSLSFGVYLLKTLRIVHKSGTKRLGGWTKKFSVIAVFCSFSGNWVYPIFGHLMIVKSTRFIPFFMSYYLWYGSVILVYLWGKIPLTFRISYPVCFMERLFP